MAENLIESVLKFTLKMFKICLFNKQHEKKIIFLLFKTAI